MNNIYRRMDDNYADLYKRYLREAILLDGKDKKIFKADCNNEYFGHPDERGESRTVLWGIAPLLRGDVCMIDTDEEKVRACRELYRGIDVQVGDVRDLPYEDGEFDVVLDFSTLDHIDFEDWEKVLYGYQRILRAWGDIIIAEWTDIRSHKNNMDVYFYNKVELDKLIRKYFYVSHRETLLQGAGELILWRGQRPGLI